MAKSPDTVTRTKGREIKEEFLSGSDIPIKRVYTPEDIADISYDKAIGLPGEPPDIVERTWEFVQETDPDLVVLSLFTVRPGTPVYNDPKKFGIKSIRTDWSDTRHMHGRYDHEVPTLTFEYEATTPWGKSLNKDQIVNNYLEFQNR